MNEALKLILAGTAGLALGAFFFYGLWWTVRRGVMSEHPALWFLGSLLLRLGATLAGFYAVAGDHWERLMACLVGFIVARAIVTRLVSRPLEPNPSRTAEASRAS
ncbi:MAG: ATP synthase subunit I [Vicinamibacteria bacterium]